MNLFFRIVVAGGLLAALPHLTCAAAESPAQTELRQTIHRFWGLAESRVENENVRTHATETSGAEPAILRPLSAAACGSRQNTLLLPPTVEARQATESRERSEHFGLNLLGGLEIFRFTWGGETRRETDELKGHL